MFQQLVPGHDQALALPLTRPDNVCGGCDTVATLLHAGASPDTIEHLSMDAKPDTGPRYLGPCADQGPFHGFSPALLQAVLLTLQSLVGNAWLLSVIVALRSQGIMLHGCYSPEGT